MKLSEIDTSVWYPVTIPSTKEITKFRPFRVREERSLLTAQESEDQSTMLATLEEIVRSCVKDAPSNLTIFDIEYLFVQIRAKSVGEEAEVIVKCKHCEADNKIVVNLTDTTLSSEPGNRVIKLSDQLTIEMQYPSIKDINKKIDAYSAIAACIECVYFGTATYRPKEGDLEEIREFLLNRTEDEMDQIEGFIRNIPTVQLDVDFVCNKCEKDNHFEIKTLSDFF